MSRLMEQARAARAVSANALAILAWGFLANGSAAADVSAQAHAHEVLDVSGVKGGLIVHLGCGDGRLTVALCANDRYRVHGLDANATHVENAREHSRTRGVYGTVWVEQFDGSQLPYIDNLVNLLVSDDLGSVPMAEVMRVLCPNGVACIQRNGTWTKTVKPWPEAIDEWTHYLHDATNNAVAHDTRVGPPRHMQWIGGPRYARHHEHMSSVSAMVSARGRVFTIFDHSSPMSIQLPSQWRLTARDAFNGTVLWARPIDTWYTHLFRLKKGPAQLPRRLVAEGERVYVTLGIEAPVTALDAATGQTVRTYAGTANTDEILFSDGTLFLLINDSPATQPANPKEYNYDRSESARRILVVNAETGGVLWESAQSVVRPLSLGVDDEHVLFSDGERIVCLDRHDGHKRWASEPVEQRKRLRTFFAPTLVIYRGVVLFSGGQRMAGDHNYGGDDNRMYGLSADTGKIIWTADHPRSGYMSPEDILVVEGLVWSPHTTLGGDSGAMIGRDPKTGEVVKRFLPDVETDWFHHRCHRSKATDKYILTSRTGIEFVDPRTEHWEFNHWVRGACLYGIMPANGMVYNPPHPCACFAEAKLDGFNALAAASPTRRVPGKPKLVERLVRGCAYDQPVSGLSDRADWPTYRADASRSGYAKTTVPAELKTAWETDLGGRLSSVVVADGKVFVASVDTHTVHALDARSGKRMWRYTTGGRIDSPPTIWQGRVLFGSADGHVYCLRADDGVLIWRFRAAPIDRRMGAFEQIESVWPVHGSVLVHKGELWCVAGRSMFLDGGLRLLRLDAATGRLISETIMDDRDPQSGENLQVRLKSLDMPVALPDVLSCDGQYVYMRSQRFDLNGVRQEIEVPMEDVTAQYDEGPHLFSPTGFLDDIWWHRSYWVFGRVFKSGPAGYYQAGRVVPAGRPMVFNDATVYGYGRKSEYYRWTTPMEYQLFATAKRPKGIDSTDGQGLSSEEQRRRGRAKASDVIFDWTQDVPVLVRAMVLADTTLFIAGPPDLVDEEQSLTTFDEPATQKQLARQAAALEGAEGALLWAVSAVDGKKLAEHKLDRLPVFDGMAAAAGRLYMTTTDGLVMCLGGR